MLALILPQSGTQAPAEAGVWGWVRFINGAIGADYTAIRSVTDQKVPERAYSPIILFRMSIATPQALAFSVIFETRNLVSL